MKMQRRKKKKFNLTSMWINNFTKLGNMSRKLKEPRHNILSHFFDGQNYDSSVWKPKNNGLLRKINTKGMFLEQKGTRMAESGKD